MKIIAISIACAVLTLTDAHAQSRSPSVDDATSIIASIHSFNSVCDVVMKRLPDETIRQAGMAAARMTGVDLLDSRYLRIIRAKASSMMRGILFRDEAERLEWCRDVRQIIDEAK